MLALALALPALTGCGATGIDFDEQLVVAMVGVFEAPADAAGNGEPKYQSYTLEDVTMTAEDGTVVDLYEGEPQAFRIINRSQIIHEGKVGEHVGATFTSLSVTFAAAVTGGGRTGELATTLPSPTATLVQAFTIDKGKSRRLKIEVQWKDTVLLDETVDPAVESMSAPTFGLELANE